jgi:hypothetical protein
MGSKMRHMASGCPDVFSKPVSERLSFLQPDSGDAAGSQPDVMPSLASSACCLNLSLKAGLKPAQKRI